MPHLPGIAGVPELIDYIPPVELGQIYYEKIVSPILGVGLKLKLLR